ncbi:hypothetical protein MF406_12645 [Georgenia sp. TF02-10]|uniref:hypothetical protein n=1 Tax=Georgenia sp. TF02-10 TaxID=2917725 RepID=UPI001FA78949|nr:hypothetical protein [Georgenia sp. TF02-10]UNX53823.1 hypothetical protein MF406_12645 [Georgenia sp. TF02-10]
MDTTVPLSGAQVLAAYFAESPALRHPARRARAAQVRAHLEVYLDTEGDSWLTDDELLLVEAERQLEPAGAVSRVTGPEALVAMLAGFVDPAWLMPAPAQRQAQLVVVEDLLAWLIDGRFVHPGEMACSLLEIEVRVQQAWRNLRARERLR